MDNYLKRDQIQSILNNAPKDVTTDSIIQGLVARGYKLEGLNDTAPVVADKNNYTFKATGNEGIVEGTAKAIGNIPSSAINLGKNLVDAVTHPIKTITAVKDIVQGAGGKVAELAFENTDIGQSILTKANQSRIDRGEKPLPVDANGKLQVIDTPELTKFKELGKYVTDRYGSTEAFKKSAIEDPVGVLADVASVFSGTGAAIKGLGTVSKIDAIADVGKVVSNIGTKLEPVNAITKTVGSVTDAVKNTTVGRIASDVIPTVDNVRSSQVTKAIDLTQGDVSTIKKLTGNEPSSYIVSKGILKGTPEEIASNLNTLRKDTMTQVRDEIGKVDKIYTSAEIPTVKKGLDVILQGVDGVPGLETVADEIRTLANKESFTLSDVQRAKEIIDENSNIYSKIGDVKSSSTAKGLGNIRDGLKTFLEDEVTTATNGQTNIKALNNDVQTSYAIEEAINNRATRSLTRQGLSVFDGMLGAGGTAAWGPAIGISVLVAKKIAETPAFRLALAKVLSSSPIKRVTSILNELKTKNLSPATIKIVNDSIQVMKDNRQILESGANYIGSTESQQN